MHLIGFSYSFYLNLKQNKKEPLRLFHVFQLPEKTFDVIPFPQVKSRNTEQREDEIMG